MVPVLSMQITSVVPKFSIELILLISDFFLYIRLAPNARSTVIMAGRPSGTAAIINAMLLKNSSIRDDPLKIPRVEIKTAIPKIKMLIFMAKEFSEI